MFELKKASVHSEKIGFDAAGKPPFKYYEIGLFFREEGKTISRNERKEELKILKLETGCVVEFIIRSL